MKIAIVNNRYGSESRGGAENVVEQHIKILRDAGHKVVVLTIRPYGSKLPKNDDGIYRVGGLSSLFTILHKLPKPIRLLWHICEALNIYKGWYLSLRLALTGCELVIGHNLTGVSLWLARFASGANMRFMLVLHDIQYLHPSGLMFKGREGVINSLQARLYQTLTRLVFCSVSRVISPSKWLAKLYVERNIFPGEKIVTLPNAFNIRGEQRANPGTSNQLLFAGQLEKHKGVLEFTEAFMSLAGDYRLVIMGDGSQKHILRTKTVGDSRIVMMDWDEVKLNNLMVQSRFLVVPSTCYENQPMAIMKAMSVGLPVMGSDFGGILELLGEGAGQIFDPVKQESIAIAITKSMSMTNDELRELTAKASSKLNSLNSHTYQEKFLEIINEPR